MAAPNVSFPSSSLTNRTQVSQDSFFCENFDPASIRTYLLQAPESLALQRDSFPQEGLGTALRTAELIRKNFPTLPTRFKIAWTFFIRDKKENEKNSLGNLCFDPSYYAEDDLGQGRWAPERRAFLITEICGESYVTDLTDRTLYQGYFIDFVVPGFSKDSLRSSLEAFLGREPDILLFTMGQRIFMPFSAFTPDDPYRNAGFVNDYLPKSEKMAEKVIPAELSSKLRDFRRMLGVCP